jgi:hypothetical protein
MVLQLPSAIAWVGLNVMATSGPATASAKAKGGKEP